MELSCKQIENLLDFIEKRPRFSDLTAETLIVEKQKDLFRKQLRKIKINHDLIPKLKEILKSIHFNALISPGECVGIAGAQAMGEFSTQATLNTFHVAGFETGSNVTTGVHRFQEIINASKNQKNINCLVFFNYKFSSSKELKQILNHKVVGIFFKSLIENMFLINDLNSWHIPCHLIFSNKKEFISPLQYYIFRFVLKKDVLFKYFLHPRLLKHVLENQFKNIICLFSPFIKRGRCYFDILISKNESLITIRDLYIPKIEQCLISGIPTVSALHFHKKNDDWYIEVEGGSIRDLALLPYVDTNNIVTDSIWDIYNVLGIEATKQFLINELSKIMYGVGMHNISLLVDKMTYSGTISSITRYTMRNEEGPLGKASFEESMETFIKAAKFGEQDNFKGISAQIIAGKKPKIGTSCFELKIDIDKIINQ